MQKKYKIAIGVGILWIIGVVVQYVEPTVDDPLVYTVINGTLTYPPLIPNTIVIDRQCFCVVVKIKNTDAKRILSADPNWDKVSLQDDLGNNYNQVNPPFGTQIDDEFNRNGNRIGPGESKTFVVPFEKPAAKAKILTARVAHGKYESKANYNNPK